MLGGIYLIPIHYDREPRTWILFVPEKIQCVGDHLFCGMLSDLRIRTPEGQP